MSVLSAEINPSSTLVRCGVTRNPSKYGAIQHSLARATSEDHSRGALNVIEFPFARISNDRETWVHGFGYAGIFSTFDIPRDLLAADNPAEDVFQKLIDLSQRYQPLLLNTVVPIFQGGLPNYNVPETNFGVQSYFKQGDPRFAVTSDIIGKWRTTYKQTAGLLNSPRRSFKSAELLPNLVFGSHSYVLKKPVYATSVLTGSGSWHFEVPGFHPRLVGSGSTPEASKRDFNRKIHVAIQKLLRRRPFQMSKSEQVTWGILEKYIDISAYKDATPISLREAGCVQQVLPSGFIEVKWLGGRVEQISLETSPPEFAAYEEGQWFEAHVERKPSIRRELIRVSNPVPIDPIDQMVPVELEEFWRKTEGLKPTADFTSL